MNKNLFDLTRLEVRHFKETQSLRQSTERPSSERLKTQFLWVAEIPWMTQGAGVPGPLGNFGNYPLVIRVARRIGTYPPFVLEGQFALQFDVGILKGRRVMVGLNRFITK